MNAVPAAALLGALALAALVADRWWIVAAITVGLLAVCVRAPRWRMYVSGIAFSAGALFVLWPLIDNTGSHPYWHGRSCGARRAHGDARGARVGHRDGAAPRRGRSRVRGVRAAPRPRRLLGAAGWARRSSLAVALATRLVPTLERDAVGLVESLRGRGVEVEGVRARARLLSPLLAGSLERA